MKNTDNLDQRFDLRLDDDTRERLDYLAKQSGVSRSKIIRILILNTTVEEIRNADE